ncbi:MAG: hypothetical protein NTY19_34445 [Planctomycetota bacterium]|nr:hypothetical protein [Planctomycetota bacterium]
MPVWGWTEPGEPITVEFAGQKQSTVADADGKWFVRLEPLPACAEPRTLVVQSKTSKHKAEISDVLVGEVWLGSGQSNMAFLVRNVRDFDQEQAGAVLPLIRMFCEESKAAATPQTNASGTWSVCSLETVGSFSATLFFLAASCTGN